MQPTNKNPNQTIPKYGYSAADSESLWDVFAPSEAPSRGGLKESARAFFPETVALGEVAVGSLVAQARRYMYKGKHRAQPEPIGAAEYVPLDTLLDGVDGAMADAGQLPTMELPFVEQPQPGYMEWDWSNSPTVQHHMLPQPVQHQPHDELTPVG